MTKLAIHDKGEFPNNLASFAPLREVFTLVNQKVGLFCTYPDK